MIMCKDVVIFATFFVTLGLYKYLLRDSETLYKY